MTEAARRSRDTTIGFVAAAYNVRLMKSLDTEVLSSFSLGLCRGRPHLRAKGIGGERRGMELLLWA